MKSVKKNIANICLFCKHNGNTYFFHFYYHGEVVEHVLILNID